MGFGYEDVAKINPRIIYCSLNGYGQSGPYATAAGYDAVIGGEAGMTRVSGDPDRPPVRAGPPVTDQMTAYHAAGALLAAVVSRQKTGKGCYIEASMFDVQVAADTYHATAWLNSGVQYDRKGESRSVSVTAFSLSHQG